MRNTYCEALGVKMGDFKEFEGAVVKVAGNRNTDGKS